MESKRITIINVLVVAVILVLLEWAGRKAGLSWNWPEYVLLGLMRGTEALVVVLYFAVFGPGPNALGLDSAHLAAGIKTGVLWSLCFALAAALVQVAASVTGHNLLPVFRMPFPQKATALLSFLVVGCLLGPLTEEIVFRGVLFGYARPLNQWAAILLSAGIFTLPHLPHGFFPSIQAAVGGLVFAGAYERSKHLAAPLIIHIAGNAAIFGLGLWQRV